MEIEYQFGEPQPEPVKAKESLKSQKSKAKWRPGIPRKMIVPALTFSVMASMALSGCGASDKKTDEITPNALPTSTLVVEGVETQEAEDTIDFIGESAEIVEKIWNEYGIDVIAPKEIDGKENLGWKASEIKILYDTLGYLPEEYFDLKGKPKIIKLIKTKGSVGSAGAFSNYGGTPRIVLSLPEFFDPINDSSEIEMQRIGGTDGMYLGTVVVHEFTHFWIVENTSVLDDWINTTGWEYSHEKWNRPEELLLASRNINPVEDLAITVQIASVNPSMLDKERLSFLARTPPFDKWGWLGEYLKSLGMVE